MIQLIIYNKIISIKMANQGLNSEAVLQNLQSVGNTTANYATETYVGNEINRKINEGYALTINIENTGVCVFTTSASSKTTVEIGLSTTLSDLNDVSITTIPPTGSYLVYNGGSWKIGSGVSKFSVTDLNDFVSTGGALVPEAFLRVNANGTSIIQDVNDVVSDVLNGNGIEVVQSGSAYTVNSDISRLPTAFASQDSPNNFFSIENTTGGTFRMQKNIIDLSGFQNSQNFVKSSGISAYATGAGSCVGMLSITSTGPLVDIVLNTDNLVTGVCGVVSIEKGGTAATTSDGARKNLQLVYNQDIIGYSNGAFQNGLTGDNIKLRGGLSIGAGGTSVTVRGSGYNYGVSGTCILNIAGYSSLGTVTATVTLDSGGGVCNVIGISPYNFFATKTLVGLTDVAGSGGSGACVQLKFDYSYLNFGTSRGTSPENGLGLRFNTDDEIVQFRESFGTSWRQLTNRFGVSGLTDVGTSSFPDSSILIYNGTCHLWFGVSISGGAGLSSDGTLTLNTTVGVSDIDTGPSGPTITTSEFVGLCGFDSSGGKTIQSELNKKIQVTGTLNPGDLIYYKSGPVPSVFSRVPTSGNGRHFLREKETAGVSIPIYSDIYHGFDTKSLGSGVSPGSTFCILNEGTHKAESYTLRDTNNYLTGSTGTGTSTGIDVNSQGVLTLNYNNLATMTYIDPSDLISIGTSVTSGLCYVRSSTVSKFLTSAAGPSSGGISHSSGNLRLQIPFFRTSTDVLTPYQGQMVFFTNATLPGPSVIAIYHGSSWFGTCALPVIF
jgi:hypothetical protein